MYKKEYMPGLVLCLMIGVPCWYAGKLLPVIGGPVFGLILGMMLALFIGANSVFQVGISFAAKKVLQGAVVLLGFGLNLSDVASVGQASLPIILSTIMMALLTSYVISKVLKIDRVTATLIGVGSSICGGSAIAATAPIVKAKADEIAQAMSVIFFFNLLAAFIFPSLGAWLGLTDYGFAVFAGTAVNDTSSVTAVASIWDSLHHTNTLETATVVKLTRTLAIIPITIALAYYYRKGEEASQGGLALCPTFILYFVGASVLTTVLGYFDIGAAYFGEIKHLAKFFIIVAMVAIGLQTNLIEIVKKGGKSLLLGGICWVVISAVSLMMQRILGLW